MRMRISTPVAVLSVLACLALAAGCGDPPKVLQGAVSAYDAAAKTLTVKDEQTPNAEVVFSIADAEIGAEPQAGDVVRLAYRDKDGRMAASRVMNLTRQEELALGGKAKK